MALKTLITYGTVFGEHPTPHPIKMVFDSKEAVYPLRLTAVAGGNTRFEIFVIGDSSASCDLLEETFCDRFSKIHSNAEDRSETRLHYLGDTSQQRIGHPAICSLMWNFCVLTKFTGTINAAEMTGDLLFSWKPFTPFQQHFCTTSGARGSAEICFVLLAGGWIFVSMIACNKRIMRPRGYMWYMAKVLLPALLLFAVVATVVFVCLPKLGASEVQTSRGFQRYHFPYDLRSDIDSILKDRADILQRTELEITDYLLKALAEMTESDGEPTNMITGTKLRAEDSPGNFTVEKQPDKVVIRVYDRTGMVLVSEYPIAAPSLSHNTRKNSLQRHPVDLAGVVA